MSCLEMLLKRHSMWSRILRDEKCLSHGFKERIGIILNYSYCSRDPAIDWMFAKLLQERIRTKGTKRREDGSVNAVPFIDSAAAYLLSRSQHKK